MDSFLICAKIGRLSVGRGRSPGFGSGSGLGWIGALGGGFEFKTTFPGPGRLNLSGNLILFLSVILDGGQDCVATSGVW